MTATFYNTARLLNYGAAEMKRLAGRHTVYGLILSVGVIGAVFLAFVGLDSVLMRTVDIPKRAIIDWVYTPTPKPQTTDNATASMSKAGGAGAPSGTSGKIAAPVAAPDITVPDTRISETDIYQSPVQDPFADGGRFGTDNNVFDPNTAIGGKNNLDGAATFGAEDEEVWKEYPDVLPQVDMNELRRKVVYPDMAQRRNLEGKVVVAVTIDASGRVVACSVAHSTSEVFNKAALEAVRLSKFTPAMRNRQPVQFRMMIPIEFKMK